MNVRCARKKSRIDWQHHERAGGHQQVPRRAAGLLWKFCSPSAERELFRALQVNQRPEEIVPDPHEREQRHHRQRRLRASGRITRQKMPNSLAAVDARGFGQLDRDRHEELPQQENVERRAEPRRHPQRLECAEPRHAAVIAEPAEDRRTATPSSPETASSCREHDGKQRPPAPEAELGKSVRDHRAGERRAGNAQQRRSSACCASRAGSWPRG